VLFEATAGGTPFLSVPVGNAEEIARWTGGGVICPAPKDERGYTRADPQQFAAEMKRLMDAPEALSELGRVARERWMKQFTWARIAERYESILRGSDAVHRPESTAERSVT
jgi:glycosyltransferase involved in cell wall biosynthesis